MSEGSEPEPAPPPRPSPPPEVLAYAAAPSEFLWEGLLAFAGMAGVTLCSATSVAVLLGPDGAYEPEGCCFVGVVLLVILAAGTGSLAASLAICWAAGRRTVGGVAAFALAGFASAAAEVGWAVFAGRWSILPFDSVAALAVSPFVLGGALTGFLMTGQPTGGDPVEHGTA
jgi:hypothetical protein